MNPATEHPHLGRLQWRCRRGMLENDLLLARFFALHGAALDASQADALMALMELADNDLLDLFLRRQELDGELDQPAVHAVLALIRKVAPAPNH